MLPGGGVWIWVFNLLLSLTLSSVVFGALFKYLPDKPVSWKAAIIGGIFTSITWQVGREVLTWWLGQNQSITAGTVVGSALAFLILVYYASLILLFGAELTSTYDELVNPDLVRPRTADDSALRGPGQPPATESGKPITEVSGGSMAKAGATGGAAATRFHITSFGVGFAAGVAALMVGARALLGKLLGRP